MKRRKPVASNHVIVLIACFAAACDAAPVGNGIIGSGTGAAGGAITLVAAGTLRVLAIDLRSAVVDAVSFIPIPVKSGDSNSVKTSLAPFAVL